MEGQEQLLSDPGAREELAHLKSALRFARGFSPIFISADSETLRSSVIDEAARSLAERGGSLAVADLAGGDASTLREALGGTRMQAERVIGAVLAVVGLESLASDEGRWSRFLADLNVGRERHVRAFPATILFVGSEPVIRDIARLAPDFFDFRVGSFTFHTVSEGSALRERIDSGLAGVGLDGYVSRAGTGLLAEGSRLLLDAAAEGFRGLVALVGSRGAGCSTELRVAERALSATHRVLRVDLGELPAASVPDVRLILAAVGCEVLARGDAAGSAGEALRTELERWLGEAPRGGATALADAHRAALARSRGLGREGALADRLAACFEAAPFALLLDDGADRRPSGEHQAAVTARVLGGLGALVVLRLSPWVLVDRGWSTALGAGRVVLHGVVPVHEEASGDVVARAGREHLANVADLGLAPSGLSLAELVPAAHDREILLRASQGRIASLVELLRGVADRAGPSAPPAAEEAVLGAIQATALAISGRTRPSDRALLAEMGPGGVLLEEAEGDATLADLLARGLLLLAATDPARLVPAWRPAGDGAHRIPEPPTPFLGRDEDLRRALDVLTSTRPERRVAITGPDGSGKTALAAAIARALRDEGAFDGGIHWISSCARGDEHVRRALVGQLGLGVAAGVPDERQRALLRSELRRTGALVVLDGLDGAVPDGLDWLLEASDLPLVLTGHLDSVCCPRGFRSLILRPLACKHAGDLAQAALGSDAEAGVAEAIAARAGRWPRRILALAAAVRGGAAPDDEPEREPDAVAGDVLALIRHMAEAPVGPELLEAALGDVGVAEAVERLCRGGWLVRERDGRVVLAGHVRPVEETEEVPDGLGEWAGRVLEHVVGLDLGVEGADTDVVAHAAALGRAGRVAGASGRLLGRHEGALWRRERRGLRAELARHDAREAADGKDAGREARDRLWVADALWPRGRYNEALVECQRAEDLARRAGQPGRLGWAQREAVWVLDKAGRAEEAVRRMYCHVREASALKTNPATYLAASAPAVFDLDHSIAAVMLHVTLEREASGHRRAAWASDALGAVMADSGRYQEGASLLLAAVQFYTEHGPDPGGTFDAANHVVWLHLELGELEEAAYAAAAVTAVIGQVEHEGMIEAYHRARATLALDRGELDAADDLLAEGLRAAEPLGRLPLYDELRGRLALLRADPRAAVAHCSAAATWTSARHRLLDHARAEAWLGLAEVHAGSPAAGLRRALRALATARHGGVSTARIERVLAEVRAAAGPDVSAALASYVPEPEDVRAPFLPVDLPDGIVHPADRKPMVLVPQGRCDLSFLGGAAYLHAFYVDQDLVTAAEFLRFMHAARWGRPAAWPDGYPAEADLDEPVVGMSYRDAEEYARWAGKVLPTCPELERVGRGVDGRAPTLPEREVHDLWDPAGRARAYEEGGWRRFHEDGVDRGLSVGMVQRLAGSISLTPEEKAQILDSIPKLTRAQLEELIRIFDEEIPKFTKLDAKHQPEISRLRRSYFRDWSLLVLDRLGAPPDLSHRHTAAPTPDGIRDLWGVLWQWTEAPFNAEPRLVGGAFTSMDTKYHAELAEGIEAKREAGSLDTGFRCVLPIFLRSDVPTEPDAAPPVRPGDEGR